MSQVKHHAAVARPFWPPAAMFNPPPAQFCWFTAPCGPCSCAAADGRSTVVAPGACLGRGRRRSGSSPGAAALAGLLPPALRPVSNCSCSVALSADQRPPSAPDRAYRGDLSPQHSPCARPPRWRRRWAGQASAGSSRVRRVRRCQARRARSGAPRSVQASSHEKRGAAPRPAPCSVSARRSTCAGAGAARSQWRGRELPRPRAHAPARDHPRSQVQRLRCRAPRAAAPRRPTACSTPTRRSRRGCRPQS